jgi:hypothetical protein
MTCIIPHVNLVRNIGFDNQATHTVEQSFASLKMHNVESITFPLKTQKQNKQDCKLDNKVFKCHYKKLEGRRNLWEKLWAKLSS